jgi:hypothetical protein
MTVLLVLFTFVIFLLIDYFRTRKAIEHPAMETMAAERETRPRLQPALVMIIYFTKVYMLMHTAIHGSNWSSFLRFSG